MKINDLTTFPDLAESVLQPYSSIVVLEDCVAHGCLGQVLATRYGKNRTFALLNLGARFIPEGTVAQLKHLYKIDADAIVATVEGMHG